jgi:hypothetical protein
VIDFCFLERGRSGLALVEFVGCRAAVSNGAGLRPTVDLRDFLQTQIHRHPPRDRDSSDRVESLHLE